MKVTVDLSGLDEFVEEVDENATELMKQLIMPLILRKSVM